MIPALDSGGAERTTLEMAKAIVAAGGRALVATAGGRLSGEVERAGGRVVSMPVDAKNPVTIFANKHRLARLIRAERVDIVHARSRAPAWSALLAARKTGAAFATTWHGAYDARSPFKRFYNSAMARADLVIANSEFTADAIKKHHSIDDRLVVIPRGADVEAFNPEAVSVDRLRALKEKWGLSNPNALILLLPGRLTDWKGHRLAVEAMASLVSLSGGLAQTGANADFQLIFAGDSQGRDRFAAALLRRVDELGLSQMIRWVGHCDDMPAAYALADIVLCPSTRPEAFGRVAAEAGAMAKPVIAADHGGARETVVAGDTGFLAEPGSAAALADQIASLIALGADGRRAMGARARARIVSKYSIAAMTAATIAAYRTLLEGRTSSAA